MFRNYLKIAVRNLWKNKGYSAINIFGLAVGLATCLLILLFVMDEISYDRFNEKADRIYRVDAEINFGGSHQSMALNTDPLGATLKAEFPQVEQYVRFREYGGFRVKKGSENVQENSVVHVDSTLFSVFSFPLLAGDARTALSDPTSVVISETIALKYFNTIDAIGKTLRVDDNRDLKVSGVVKNIPTQSHIRYDFFVPLHTEESRQGSWLSHNFSTYIVLKVGSDKKQLEGQLDGFVKKYVGPQAQSLLNASYDDILKSGSYIRYSLMPLTDIYLHSNKVGEIGRRGNMQYVYIFSAIALFILLIACVNFMNLSTARSSNRAKEVGVRKVLGSQKQSLVTQFLTESIFISFVSLLIALCIAQLMLPLFNELAGKEITLGFFTKPWLLPSLIALMLVVGLLAGSYPSFYLSSFQPITVLKGKLAGGFRHSWLRSSLVVFQFSISVILIVGTVVIYSQLSYIRSKNLGFNREQVLVVHNGYPLGEKAKSFKNEIKNLKGVEAVSMTGYLPTSDYRGDSPIFSEASLDQKSAVSMQNWYVDEEYVPAMKMEMAKGRNFSTQMVTDSSGIIINEAAARLLPFPEPVGQTVYYVDDFQTKQTKPYRILGVLKDFNFNSLREQVTPMALFYREERGKFAIRFQTENAASLLAQVESIWKNMAPGQPFSYSFMDEDFNRIYQGEQRVGKIALSFSVLAILIACLGLFGLVTYAAEQRTKEIGIRKVLGASVSNIVNMLSLDFVKLVVIALFIAFPLAWFAMNKWLQDFAYRIQIDWKVFLLAGIAAFFIALVTVSVQAVKAALTNPVKNLRTE
ncbi:ABC transporter permease [Flavisolibacter sp. BT320]|nr:ABC transporter permease [Flavisolibacter longurius]